MLSAPPPSANFGGLRQSIAGLAGRPYDAVLQVFDTSRQFFLCAIAFAVLALSRAAAAQPAPSVTSSVAPAPSIALSAPATDVATAKSTGATPDPVAERRAADARIERTLSAVFSVVEELKSVKAQVRSGVVKLTGSAASGDHADKAVKLAKGLDGVLYVDNDIDVAVEVTERVGPTMNRLRERAGGWLQKLPLFGVAIGVMLLFAFLGRVVRSAKGLYRLIHGKFLQELTARLLGAVVLGVGILIALELLDATALVGAVFGAAGVAGIAIGFAFKDIIENYLASVLMSLRRPFKQNDHVMIGDREGKVVRLTGRETILMTLDGNHLRLPNASVFKAEILNYTRNPQRRFDFSVGVGVEEDLTRAVELGVKTLKATPGIEQSPPPESRIEELGDSTVALRFYGWVDQREADWGKVRSEAIRRVKVRLDAAGVDMPVPTYQVDLRQGAAADSGEKPERKPRPTDTDVERSAHEVSVDDYLDRQIEADEAGEGEDNLLD